jgi:hypothetical protein
MTIRYEENMKVQVPGLSLEFSIEKQSAALYQE